jgi:phosphoadenosine phosphosulfate reductase
MVAPPVTSISQVPTERVEQTVAILEQAVRDYSPLTYSCSLGLEGMVLIDLIWTRFPEIDIFTLDTGRLHEETRLLLERLEIRYKRSIRVVYPEALDLENYVATHGMNGFYKGLEERKTCCFVRKVAPFRRATKGKRAWITGVRRSQSDSRAAASEIAWDPEYNLYKVNPLLDWTDADIWNYVRAHRVPYNSLHDRGFTSIGCAPCTRAIQPGEHPRAGRWWWEQAETRECGLQSRVRAATP